MQNIADKTYVAEKKDVQAGTLLTSPFLFGRRGKRRKLLRHGGGNVSLVANSAGEQSQLVQ